MMDGELPLFGHNRYRYRSDAGWDVPKDFSFDDWLVLGAELGQRERETPWAIGDWWNLGEPWDRGRTELIRSDRWQGPSHETCHKYGYVGNCFKPWNRFQNLDFKHHQEAASLAKADRKAAERLLKKAATEGWSAADLAKHIRRHRATQQVAALPHEPPGSTPENPWGNVQHFDIWQFQAAADDSEYFGKLPRQVAENLLWHFTDPGHLIVDPFAGGGIMLDVADAMGRHIWASDLSPSRDAIHQHDIAEGWPCDGPGAADLIFLDPPYWEQARGRYGEKDTDLGNMELQAFYDTFGQFVGECAEHLTDDGRLAFIISPTQCEDGSVTDHAADLTHICWQRGFVIERRIIVPYQTQQATGQQVEWARTNRRLLKLYRDLIVMRLP